MTNIDARKVISDKLEEYGIRKIEDGENKSQKNFAYSPGISQKHVNDDMREKHRTTMLLGAAK